MKNQRRALGLTRRRSRQVPQRDAQLLPRLQPLNAGHPFWGERRLWADRRFVERMPVHTKRMLRLRREPHLLAPPTLRLKAQRTLTGSNPNPTTPTAWWGIEMTTGMGAGCGWIDIVVGLDWDTRKLVGS